MSDTLVVTYPRSLSLWRYVSVMLASTGFCLYGGMCTIYIVWGGVIYVQVYRQKVKAVRAWEWSDGYTSPITLW